MRSLKEFYRIGHGPTSAFTISPDKCCRLYRQSFNEAKHFQVTLFGKLARHSSSCFTAQVISEAFAPFTCDIVEKPLESRGSEYAFTIIGRNEHYLFPLWEIAYGDEELLTINGQKEPYLDTYASAKFSNIKEYCASQHLSLCDYIFLQESDLRDYLTVVLNQMLKTVDSGLKKQGVLPGDNAFPRLAKNLNMKAGTLEKSTEKIRLFIMSYAYAAAEESADGAIAVSAPTLASGGVLAAAIKYYHLAGIGKTRLVNALAIAGLFGNVVKHNIVINGRKNGCQVGIGTACAMAAAAIAYLEGLNLEQIEKAASIALEHNLGLVCDQVNYEYGFPCIERNAVAVLRAFDVVMLAKNLPNGGYMPLSFDKVVDNLKNYHN